MNPYVMNRAFPAKEIPEIDEYEYFIRRSDTGACIPSSKERASAFKYHEELAKNNPDVEFILYRAVKAMKNKSTTTHQLLAKDLE